MNADKLLFAQLMDFIPWTSFARSVAHYGDRRVRSLTCTEQYRAMAFAQLTYRESLRDIEACLNTQPNKLYSMGFRAPVRRSTLADANQLRDWRIYAELAQRLMAQKRKLYASQSLGIDLDAAAYALDSTNIDLCLSLFPWAHFRSTKSAIKIHTLLDLRGSIPAFIRVTSGDRHDVNMLDEIVIEPGAYYVMDRGYLDFFRLHRIHLAGAFFVTRARSDQRVRRVYSRPADKPSGIMADQLVSLEVFRTHRDYPSHLRRIRFYDPETGKRLIFLTNQFTLPARTICALYKSRWRVEFFSNGSSSTCASRPSTAPLKTRSRRRFGSPFRSTCWLPSSKSDFNSPALSTLFSRCSQSRCSRKCPFHSPFSSPITKPKSSLIPTN